MNSSDMLDKGRPAHSMEGTLPSGRQFQTGSEIARK
jgi:hypothetical protein